MVVAAAFGAVFIAASGAAPPPACPIPGNFEIDGDMLSGTCNPAGDDWNTPNIGVQSTSQQGTYSTSGKDDGNPSGWSSSGATPDKTDFDRAYATSRVVGGHFYVFVAWERTSTTGTQGYAIEVDNSGSHVSADGTPQPIRGNGGAVFYISSQGASAPAFDSACKFTMQSDYGQSCTNSSASVTSAINTASITDPLNGNAAQAAGSFFEVALDVTALTGIAPSCPGPSAASVYLRSITGQTSNGNLKGYMAPLNVAPDSTCAPPPITTTATPGGSTNLPGATQHDDVTVGTQAAPGIGSVTFFLCSPAEVTANGGDCSANGTQVGNAVPLDVNGQATSDDVSNDTTIGKYCWRAEFAPGANDHHYLPGTHTNSTTECFTVIKASPSVATRASVTGNGVVGTDSTSDTATVSGGDDPSGSIQFSITDPNGHTSNVGSPVSVSGDGTYDAPSSVALTLVGTYTWSASYSGDSLNNGAVDNGDNESITSIKASPSVATRASVTGNGVVGTDSTSDTATVSGGDDPSGSIQFSITDPNGHTSDVGAPVTVSGDGDYPSPSSVALTLVGTYTWHAHYSGDSLNNGAVDNGDNESVTSIKASPSVATKASVTGNGVVGTDSTSDTATVSGGDDPSGTIQFSITDPNGHTSNVGSPVSVSGDGDYPSPSSVALTLVGTYTWHAHYSGDSLNNGADDNGDNESITSIKTTPSITTLQDPASGSVGDTFDDKATLSGTFQQDGSGSIKWTLYPNDDCSGTPLDTESLPVNSDGTFETPTGVAVNSAGTYYWVAEFSGDSNNAEATSGCADEPVAVKGASIHILKTADKPQVNAGEPIGFTMTVWDSGDGDAHGVTLSDKLPTNPGLNWQIADQGTGWAGTCGISQGELTCGPVNVPAGTDKDTSTFTVHITSDTDKTTGGVCPDGNGVVSNTGDVKAANDGTDESTATTCVAAPVIHILKTADAAQVMVGQPIGFTMKVWNDGSGDAHGVKLTDTLPAEPGLSWSVDKTGSGFGSSCSINQGVLSCGGADGVTVPAGTAKDTSVFTVHITSGTTADTAGDCPKSGVVDNEGDVTTSNDGSDQSSASTCVQALVDLAVTKSGSPASQFLGQGNITWTMVVTNNGPDTDTGVTVADPMPNGNTFVSANTNKQGATCTGGAILNCDLGTMAAGDTVTITLITQPTAPGTVTNTVHVVGDRPETNTANNTATASVQVNQATPPPPVFCVAVSRVTPQQLFVGRKTKLTIHVTQHDKAVKGIHVRITGPKVNVRTKASNSKGVITRTITMRKAGILIFSPIASRRCNTQRVGVTNVFTPPVTG